MDQCLNLTNVQGIAADIANFQMGNLSNGTMPPFNVRMGQTYLKMVNYLESGSNHCQYRPPLHNSVERMVADTLRRNLVEDEIAFVNNKVLIMANRCICQNQQWNNETIRQCISRMVPITCYDEDFDFFFSKDDFRNKMKIDVRKMYHPRYHKKFDAARVFFALSFVLAFLASSLAAFVYFKSPGLQTVANIFIINLILANSILTILELPVEFMETIIDSPYPWIIPRPLWLTEASCRAYYFIRYLGFYATSYSLALIGYERYNAICKPLESQRQMSKKRALKMVGATWLISAILTIPSIFSHVRANNEPFVI